MAKWKKFTLELSAVDVMDVKLRIEKNNVVEFSLNYRTMIDGRYYEVYRVDTAHGYLHEQKCWVSPEPIPLHLHNDLNYIFDFYFDHIKENFERYKKHYFTKTKLR